MATTLAILFATLGYAQTTATARGQRPGTERWIVMLKDRSFDLGALRLALTSQPADAATVDQVVADLAAAVVADQAALVDLVRSLDGAAVAQWWLVNGLAIEIAPDKLDALRAHPRVHRLLPDQPRQPGIKTSTNAANHATDVVHASGVRGAGVTVAIIDSGVDENMAGTGRPHATFYIDGDVNNRTGGGIGGSRLLANVQLGRSLPDDLINHGTAVAGVAAGARWNTGNVADDGHAPSARIVSYCVADDVFGGTSATVLTTAWQLVVADKVRYGIKVANCSYEGFFGGIVFPDQEALQAAAYLGDLVITGMAGNGGIGGAYGYAACNMLAVGGCEHDNRHLAPFSLRGPAWPFNRNYPDLIANGVNIVMPSADAEAQNRTAQGTSYSSAQVAGAAALYRSVRPSANALECRAAILATVEDVRAVQSPPDQNANAIGHGYLRVDRLVHAAQAASITSTSLITQTIPTRSFPLTVRSGLDYGVAISWFWPAVAQSTGDLDLQVLRGSVVLASASTPDNVDEVIRLRATADEQLEVRVLGRQLNTLPIHFALVATELRFVVSGSLVEFGSSCGLVSLRSVQGAPPPAVGQAYAVDCNQASSVFFRPMVMLMGADNTQHGGFPLPFDLTPLGAPGCALRISPEVYQPVPGSTFSASVRMVFPVPNQRSLIGRSLFHQTIRFEPTANSLGLETSNGLQARIGGVR